MNHEVILLNLTAIVGLGKLPPRWQFMQLRKGRQQRPVLPPQLTIPSMPLFVQTLYKHLLKLSDKSTLLKNDLHVHVSSAFC